MTLTYVDIFFMKHFFFYFQCGTSILCKTNGILTGCGCRSIRCCYLDRGNNENTLKYVMNYWNEKKNIYMSKTIDVLKLLWLRQFNISNYINVNI